MTSEINETIAKEITVAILPKIALDGKTLEDAGEQIGQLYKTILKEVTEANKETQGTKSVRQSFDY